MRPLEAIRFALETTTGAATTRFFVKTAAAEAGTSLERSARSSAPVFSGHKRWPKSGIPAGERLRRGHASWNQDPPTGKDAHGRDLRSSVRCDTDCRVKMLDVRLMACSPVV